MSAGQLSLLKKLADDQEFGTEVSVTPDEVQYQNHRESNDETSPRPSSLVKEDGKSYSDDKEEEADQGEEEADQGEESEDEDETRDEDSDDDESSYESTETSDGTEDVDSSSSELPQSSSDVTLKEGAEKSFSLEEHEEIGEHQKEESKNLESSNKTAKSVSFDGIGKSKKTVSPEGSGNTVLTRGTTPDILTVHKDSSPGRKKMTRQEHINLGGSDENIASVSVNKANSPSSINVIESARTSKEPSSEHSRRNPSMRIPCVETSSNLENSSSRLCSVTERRKKKRNGWMPPVSADERLDRNYRELYQLLTRDVEVKGEARQLVHAYQMEQLYDKYVSVSHGFVKRTYVMPRSVLSVRDDSTLEKVRSTKDSKRSRSPSKSNRRSSPQSGKNSRQTLNDQHLPPGNSSLSSTRFVDHRHGESSNPDILKWLHGKNHMYFKQKREERARKQLQKETKRQETLMRAERLLESQQAVYIWMQQKLKEYQQGSPEEKKFCEKKSEMRKTNKLKALRRDTFVEDKMESKNGEQSSIQALPNKPPKVKGHLKPLQGQIKTNKENKASVKSEHFKHMESTLSYDAWTRQTGNVGCRKTVNNCADFKGDSDDGMKFHKKMLKDEESSYSAADKEYSEKENKDIGSLQENGTDLKPKDEEPSPQKKSIRPKTAYGSRVRHSTGFNFDAVSEKNGNVRSPSDKKVDESSLSDSTSELNENESEKISDSDRNDSGNDKKIVY